mmetsp:Transcript_7402/g.14825  ORF Transcript_7402/g.14825 Transcript_7402/m.14825 type:complete len:172 (+) Transcript_7402:43-558(+)|eukprot:CAMPEP_0119070870 /NCGR_PEP_ID=MMETSP1178-20130426/44143_1 /TAXON_ID=33656 /ORGANISM="unid sp, Strain CCMP2000" /LENGTH=171 /DNA_ID=CAMNT_0007052747 /DNA_START=43 /DNA_END=558 /DNA_ORIENTATION=-
MDDEGSGRAATVGSVIGGAVCSIGWYVWIAMLLLPSHNDSYVWDCKAQNITDDQYIAPCEFSSGAYWAPGLLMTLGVIMLNIIKWTSLGDDMSMGDDSVATKAKVYVGVCFVIMFCSLGGGVWIVVQDGARLQDDDTVWVGPGIAVLVQCVCLFLGGLIFRIVRRKEEHAI